MPTEPPRIAVDRIEGDIAVLDTGGQAIEIPAALLPAGAGEGSLLVLSLAPAVEAAEKKTAAEERLERLRRRSPKPTGAIDL